MANRVTPLSGELKDIFETEKALTEYAKTHPIVLKNILIKDHDISHTTLLKGSFTNTHWDDVVYQYANITNVTFENGSMYDVSFARSILTNVVFENIEMEKMEFIGATLINVTFKNCKIDDSEIRNLKTSKIIIEKSELNEVSFFESQLDVKIKNSRLEAVSFMGLKSGSKIYIEDTKIGPYSEFDHSELTSFTLKNSEVLDAKMHFSTIDELNLENVVMDFPFGGGTFNLVKIINVDNVLFDNSKLNSLIIEDCKNNTEIFLQDSKFKKITIRNCPTDKIDIKNSKGVRLSISDMSIGEALFNNLIVKELILNKVSITEDANFNGALAEESLITNFSIKKGSKVNMNGTNIKFN